MATVTKEWTNGDLLTLVTSAGGIAVSSDENLTGEDREMTIRVQTTNQGAKEFQDVLIKQNKMVIVEDGYWVHKDTGVKTYFGADADFINNGVMSQPPWIENAKEIRLCTGITAFATTYDPTSGVYLSNNVFTYLYDVGGLQVPANGVLEKLDFGNAVVQTLPANLIIGYGFNSYQNPPYIPVFRELILNSSVQTIDKAAIGMFISTWNVVITVFPGLQTVGGYISQEGQSHYMIGIANTNSSGGAFGFVFLTPSSNVSTLQNLLANAGGAGVSGVHGGYQVLPI